MIQLMQSSSTFLGFLGSTAYFRFVLLKLMVNLKIRWMANMQLFEFGNSDTKLNWKSETEHVHLWPSHVQLVEDVFLNTGGGGGCQGHHWHFGELLTQLMQPLVIWAEIMAPLKDLRSQKDSQ